jgi:hypothetical protein
MRLVLISLVVVLMCNRETWAQAWGKIKVGEPFPTIVLPSLQGGKPMSVADFYGKKTILHLFASW